MTPEEKIIELEKELSEVKMLVLQLVNEIGTIKQSMPTDSVCLDGVNEYYRDYFNEALARKER